MHLIHTRLREALLFVASEENRASSQRFFKESIVCYGVKSPEVRAISKDFFVQVKALPKTEALQLCEALWQSGVIEESFVACHWSEKMHKLYEPSDFGVFERWIHQYVSNWASCDTLCNHTVGDFVMRYPDFVSNLKGFALSDNRWTRRAAAVSLIIPARKGLFLNDIFEIADLMLTDSDDMVQKGYGWMLKAASQAYPQEVLDFVLARKERMPRTALRYAIEKMTDDMKRLAMAK